MASSLPDDPSLDHLRTEARRLQRDVASGAPKAIRLVRRWHPAPDRVLPDARDRSDDPEQGVRHRFALNAAQLTVARRYGFTRWSALVGYLDVVGADSRNPSDPDRAELDPVDEFTALACLGYDVLDEPPRWQQARELWPALLAEGRPHIWAAAAAGDADVVERMLATDPRLAGAEGGPHRWVPLLYLTYSRFGTPDDAAEELRFVRTAELLLDAGASAGAGFLWRGLATPFTALTGVFGEGEQGPRRQPPHPYERPLAELLLSRGADPDDGQALYNRMFRRGDEHLETLYAHGLGDPDRPLGYWARRLGEALETREQLLAKQLAWAADHGFTSRVELFAAHGMDLDAPLLAYGRPETRLLSAHERLERFEAGRAAPDPAEGGRTRLHQAAWDGDLARIRELLAAGSDPGARDDEFRATPLDWAEHAYQTEAAELLRPVTPDTSG